MKLSQRKTNRILQCCQVNVTFRLLFTWRTLQKYSPTLWPSLRVSLSGAHRRGWLQLLIHKQLTARTMNYDIFNIKHSTSTCEENSDDTKLLHGGLGMTDAVLFTGL